MTYDYIIVGGGSAGCALASRLSEDPAVSVLVLEAGPRDRHPFIHIPIGYYKTAGSHLTWLLETTPQRHLYDRVMPFAQARVLGGGSSINGQVFVRGVPQDFDRWANEEGCPGWSFADVQPYFLRSEKNLDIRTDWHSQKGPLGVSNLISPREISLAFVESCKQYGLPYNPDFNGPTQEGCGLYQTHIFNGRRCSSARAYLRPVRHRKNLTVRTDAEVMRVIVERGRARGVEIAEGRERRRCEAAREVIVTGGAIGSPKLLMLSGIGPADHLRAVGVPVIHDMPGVGSDMHDQLGVDVVYELSGPYGLDPYASPHRMLLAGLQYALFRKGPATSNIVEGGAFTFIDKNEPSPDMQYHLIAGSVLEEGIPPIPSGYGCRLNSQVLRPRSRGTVRLRSADHRDKALCDPNYLAESYDVELGIEGVLQSRELMNNPAMARYITREHYPGAKAKTRTEITEFMRRFGHTSYHPVGSCRMGSDPGAVVDPALRVRGIEGLRVCDSSIFPSMISSNTNATSIMIGEKAADIVKAG